MVLFYLLVWNFILQLKTIVLSRGEWKETSARDPMSALFTDFKVTILNYDAQKYFIINDILLISQRTHECNLKGKTS